MRSKHRIFKHRDGEFFKHDNNEKKTCLFFLNTTYFLNECVTFSLICKILL